jgi:hypothetical protein
MEGHDVRLNWQAPDFGQIRTYYIWRSDAKAAVKNIAKVTGSVPLKTTFLDTTVKKDTTYTYFVTAALGGGQSDPNNNLRQSGPSNLYSIKVVF